MPGLLEAFRQIAPQIGDPALDRLRNEAACLLFGCLRQLNWSTALLSSLPQHDRDEAIAVVLVRLVQAGPRGTREGDPADDDGVRRYLRVALQNAARDLVRDRKRPDAPGPEAPASEPPAPASGTSPEVQLDRSRAALAMKQALGDLRDEVLPLIGAEARKDAAERTKESVDELLAIYRGLSSVEHILDEENAAVDEAGRKRSRQALYQKYHRAIERLLQAVGKLEREGALSEGRCHALRILVGELRLRKDGEARRGTKRSTVNKADATRPSRTGRPR